MNNCLNCGKQIADNRKTCSHSCAAAYGNIQRGVKNLEKYNSEPNLCLYCGKPIIHREGDILQFTQVKKFCNKSCFGFYQGLNRNIARLYKDFTCKKCGENIRVYKKNKSGGFSKRLVCDECKKGDDISNLTIKDIYDIKDNWQAARAAICSHARTIYYQNDGDKFCKYCGYDKHVEVCHIKGVAEFDKSAIISSVNSIDNLIGLCRNHHWELDHGLLSIDEILYGGVEERPSSIGS